MRLTRIRDSEGKGSKVRKGIQSKNKTVYTMAFEIEER